jgi:hypothetical protein
MSDKMKAATDGKVPPTPVQPPKASNEGIKGKTPPPPLVPPSQAGTKK